MPVSDRIFRRCGGTDDDEKPTSAPSPQTTTRNFCRTRVQDHDRSVCGAADRSSACTRALLASLATRFTTRLSGKKERIGRLLQMHANQREEIKEVLRRRHRCLPLALKEATTGDTLCDPRCASSRLERMVFPEPVISQAVEPKTKADQEKMGIALNRLAAGRSFVPRSHGRRVAVKRLSSAWANCTLKFIVDRMKREFGVEAKRRQTTGSLPRNDPQVLRPTSKANSCKPVGWSSGQYGHVVDSRWSRKRRAKATSSSTRLKAASVPREFIPAVAEGLRRILAARMACSLASRSLT